MINIKDGKVKGFKLKWNKKVFIVAEAINLTNSLEYVELILVAENSFS